MSRRPEPPLTYFVRNHPALARAIVAVVIALLAGWYLGLVSAH